MLKFAILGITLFGSAIANPQNGMRVLADSSDLPEDKSVQESKNLVGQFQVVGTLCYAENMAATDEVTISKSIQVATPSPPHLPFVLRIQTYCVGGDVAVLYRCNSATQLFKYEVLASGISL